MMKKWPIYIAGFVIAAGLFFYVVHFFNNPISDKTSDWESFSSYINPFIAFANLIIFVWFSYLVYKYNLEKDNQDDLFKRTTERPVLVFVNPGETNEVWAVKNIGKGAALNLKIFESPERNVQWILPGTKCYSLGNGETLNLDWLKAANMIVVLYEDVFSTKYISLAADDETQVRELVDEEKQKPKKFEPISIQDREFKKLEFEMLLDDDSTIRMAEARYRRGMTKSTTTTTQTTSIDMKLEST
jgi:hypothetical protein